MVKGKDLKLASGKNLNPFFETANVKNPIISENAKLHELNLASSQLYDLSTEAGKNIFFSD